jgi:hypothetical protein
MVVIWKASAIISFRRGIVAQLDTFALVSTIIGIILIVVLVAVSIVNLRTGRQALERARSAGQPIVWHKQLSILFALNNLVFACLILLIILLMLVADHTMKYIFVALIALFLVVSVFLVVRCIMAALQASRDFVSSSSRRDDKLP